MEYDLGVAVEGLGLGLRGEGGQQARQLGWRALRNLL